MDFDSRIIIFISFAYIIAIIRRTIIHENYLEILI